MTTSGFLIVNASEQGVEERHGFARSWALTPENTGFRDIRICSGIIPPHTATTPHWHTECETAIYIIKGRVKVYIGPGLAQCYEAGSGDFIYVGKGLIHQTITLDEPCEYVQVRDKAVEDAIEYDPAQDQPVDNQV